MRSQSSPGMQLHAAPNSELMSRLAAVNNAGRLKRLVSDPQNTQYPASFLQLHPNLTVVCEAAAAGGLK